MSYNDNCIMGEKMTHTIPQYDLQESHSYIM